VSDPPTGSPYTLQSHASLLLDYDVAFAVSALAIVGSAVAVWIAAPRKADVFRRRPPP
jgi:hypothetical protein